MKVILKCNGWQFVKSALITPAVSAGLMVLVVSFFRSEDAGLVLFFFEVVVGAIVYIAAAYLLDRTFKFGLLGNLRLIVLGNNR